MADNGPQRSPPVTPPAVRIRGLHVRRGNQQVFSGFDLDVKPGRITGLLGPSGCGKTTLMRAIVGLQAVQGGELTVLGRPAGSSALRRQVTYATQAVSVYDDLSVRQNIRYFAHLRGASRRNADRVMELVRLESQSERQVSDLSGGQRSRVSLAAAMVGDPDLLILDEPTVGLDPLLRVELWQIFRTITDGGATLLVSSHVMDEALHCDELILMREGRILAQTTPGQLLADTGADRIEAAFLSMIRADSESRAA